MYFARTIAFYILFVKKNGFIIFFLLFAENYIFFKQKKKKLKMDIFIRNLQKVEDVRKELPNLCPSETEAFDLCQRIQKKNGLKCELSLKALILCFRNKGGVFINYE